MKYLIALCALCLALPAYAVTDLRETDEFDSIYYALPYDVEFEVADEHYVRFEGDEDEIDNIELEVDGDRLELRHEESSWFSWSNDVDKDAVVVTVGYVAIDELTMAGSGDGFAEILEADLFEIVIAGSARLEVNDLEANDLEVTIAGSGDLEVHSLETDTIECTIAGSGDVELAGDTNAQEVSIAGSGDYDAGELRAQETEATTRGSGDIVVWTESRLKATIMGSGDIEYYGDPDVRRSIMGSGDLHRVADEP